jgi:hypothetical protein
LGSMKGEWFLDQLNDYKLLKNCAQWSVYLLIYLSTMYCSTSCIAPLFRLSTIKESHFMTPNMYNYSFWTQERHSYEFSLSRNNRHGLPGIYKMSLCRFFC